MVPGFLEENMVITGALTHLRKDQVTCQQGWKGKAPSHMPVDPWNLPRGPQIVFPSLPAKSRPSKVLHHILMVRPLLSHVTLAILVPQSRRQRDDA